MSLQQLTEADRVDAQRGETVSDGALGWIESWTTVARLPCRIRPVRARDVARWDRLGQEVSHVLYFSEQPPLAARTRFVHGRRIFVEPRALDVDEQHRLWVIGARELPSA